MGKKIALSLNSGGMMGVMELVLLKHLDGLVKEKFSIKYPKVEYKGLTHHIDYFGGSSVGSINIAWLVVPNENGDLRDIDELFKIALDNNGKMIVLKPFCITSFLTQAIYDNKKLEKVFHSKVGDKTFKDIQKKVLITSFNIETNTQTLFSNIGSEEDRKTIPGYVWDINNIKIKDALMCSTAAQTAFPPHRIQYERLGFAKKPHYEVDDGIFSASPVERLITAIIDLEEVRPSDLLVISISFLLKDNLSEIFHGGLLDYALGIKKLAMQMILAPSERSIQAMNEVVSRQGGKFFPIEIRVQDSQIIKMLEDNLKNFKMFKEIGEKYCKEHADELSVMADTIVDWIEVN